MEIKTAVTALAALAQESRLSVFRLLVAAGPAGMAAGKVGEALGIAPSSLSFHLKELLHAGMVTSRQEGRFVIYRADFAQAAALVAFLSDHCCGGQPCALGGALRGASGKVWSVLILCTGNSARSILAEALINHLGKGRVRAYSAGNQPTGRVHPLALEKLRASGYPTDGLRSKSWDEFAVPGAPQMDAVITVCDNAAGEVCPLWPGQPARAHWGFADPAAATGSDEDRRRAFDGVFERIRARVQALLALPLETLDAAALQRALRGLGQADAAAQEGV